MQATEIYEGKTEIVGAALTAAMAMGRLDQALAGHVLERAFLYRARLEAVRRQAAVDGQAIDPWHLAAILEGLRLRMDPSLCIAERGAVFAAAHQALVLHGWLSVPDEHQRAEILRAMPCFEGPVPLLAAARGFRAGLAAGFSRAPMRAALVAHWTHHGVLRCPVPLTGAAALATPRDADGWTVAFLAALGEEAVEALALLDALARAWRSARAAVGGRRRHSRAAAAVDILAAAPLVSATSLGAGLGMARNNAAALLEEFCQAGIAVEVSLRARRRLFGLAGFSALRAGVLAPRRPQPGRGRGRPLLAARIEPALDERPPVPAVPPRDGSPTSLSVPMFDYAELELWMARTDEAVRHARATLSRTAPRPSRQPPPAASVDPGTVPSGEW